MYKVTSLLIFMEPIKQITGVAVGERIRIFGLGENSYRVYEWNPSQGGKWTEYSYKAKDEDMGVDQYRPGFIRRNPGV